MEKLWENRFCRLLSDVQRWHEHLEDQKNPKPVPEGETPEQTKRRTAMVRWRGLPEEILNAPAPLAALIEKNKPDPAVRDDPSPW